MQKILWDEDTLVMRDTPSPDLTPFVASIFAPTALKLNVTPPEKNPSYGLDLNIYTLSLHFLPRDAYA